VQASAKIVASQGDITAVDTAGQRRRLVDGGSVYAGDLVETGAGTRAVLAFRDESRVSLGATTRFRVDNFVYDDKNPSEGRFLVSLLRGSVRALTGLIAKSNNRNVGFATSTATIGIRGTGFDLDCGESCDAGTNIYTWLGSIVVNQQGQTALQVLSSGQGLFISPTQVRPFNEKPGETSNTPARPDTVNVPPSLFSNNDLPSDQSGLFIFVRDGHIEVTTSNEVLHLGKGEAGFAGAGGGVARPSTVPLFLDLDKAPLPGSKNPMLSSLLSDSGVRSGQVCK
jgi:hypothetical protein